jgi:hypothetical protein
MSASDQTGKESASGTRPIKATAEKTWISLGVPGMLSVQDLPMEGQLLRRDVAALARGQGELL